MLLFPSLLLSCLLHAQPQNLVPNPSFEKYKQLPANVGEGKICLADWVVPVAKGNGDYYHADAKNEEANTEHNYFGGQSPHEGKAYAGFCVTETYREYLQVPLVHPLEKGKRYRLSFYISSGDKAWLSHLKEIDVLFTSRMMTIPFGQPMYEPPQVVFYAEKGYTDSENWTLLSTEFVADGTESVMTIGAFEWKTEKPVLINGISRSQNPPLTGLVKDVHYFVDDVSLAEVNAVTIANALPDSLPVQQDTSSAELKGKTIVLRTILFENDRAELKPEASAQLDPLADWLASHPGSSIRIGGHTDSKGDDDHNMKLSQARAEAVKAYLVSKGIAPERITATGYGETQPIAPNDTKEGREQNRRVEISFL